MLAAKANAFRQRSRIGRRRCGASAPRNLFDDCANRWRHRAQDEGHAPFGDSRFFPSDVFQRRPQSLGVVQSDACDGCCHGTREHVGSIEPATDADLNDGEVDASFNKRYKGSEGCRLEERQVRRLEQHAR